MLNSILSSITILASMYTIYYSYYFMSHSSLIILYIASLSTGTTYTELIISHPNHYYISLKESQIMAVSRKPQLVDQSL